MTDAAKRAAGPVAVTASTATYYTVPASTSIVIRSIHVANTTTAAITFTLGIGGTTAALSLWSGFSIPANGSLDWSGFLALATTETIQAVASATGLTLTINGVTTV
jgi:hypothetical protein